MRPFSLYLHIPFCFHKCPYCDFNTYAVTHLPENEYLNALLAELDARAMQSGWRGREVATIFFGGGTPSLISPAGIKRVLNAVASLFPVASDVEISLEANPGTISIESLQGYRAAGVNRLSIGAQSFQPEQLRFLGRLHSAEQVEEGFEAARVAGLKNINIDLMHGLPSQSVPDLDADLARALRLQPEHVSAYGLTIEKGTPLHASFARGTFKLPPEERLVSLMQRVNEVLPDHGFTHYEISNFAQPGKEARHNLAYWNSNDYLGVGAGAHSYLCIESPPAAPPPQRWSNYAVPAKYIKEATSSGLAAAWHDSLDLGPAVFDFVYLGLRKLGGVSLSEFAGRFGMHLPSLYPSQLNVLRGLKFIVLNEEHLRLTPQGLLLADSVIAEFSEPALKQAEPSPITWYDAPGKLSWAANS